MKYHLPFVVLLSLNVVRCLVLLDENQLRSEAVFIGGITSRDIQQRLIPEIKFSCSGTLTKWVIVASEVGDGLHYPELQIWRRTGSGNDFTKVGHTVFSRNSVSTISKVYEQIVDPPLSFESGDVLGVYTPPLPKLTFKYQKKGGPTNYYIGGPANSRSSFSLNGAGVLSSQNDYPLVSVEVNGTGCTSRFIDRGTLELKASLLTVNSSDLYYSEATQRVIPELMFSESGEIESFTVGALHRGTGSKYPLLQVWRGAGEREWTRVTSSSLTPAISSTEYLNVYQYTLSPPLEVQAGDILGIYQPYSSASVLKLYYQDEGPLNYYQPALGSSTDRINEEGTLIRPRRNRPLLTMIFKPYSPTPVSTTTTGSTTGTTHSSASPRGSESSTAVLPKPTGSSSPGPTKTHQPYTTHHSTARPTPTRTPAPTSAQNITQIILLVCVTILILILVVFVILVLIVLIKRRLSRELRDTTVDQSDDKSLDYNINYAPQNPREIICNGRKQVVDLGGNTAYNAPPKLETVEHVYDTID